MVVNNDAIINIHHHHHHHYHTWTTSSFAFLCSDCNPSLRFQPSQVALYPTTTTYYIIIIITTIIIIIMIIIIIIIIGVDGVAISAADVQRRLVEQLLTSAFDTWIYMTI